MSFIYNYGQIFIILGGIMTPVSILYFVYNLNSELDYFHGIGTAFGGILIIVGLIMWIPSSYNRKYKQRLRNYHY